MISIERRTDRFRLRMDIVFMGRDLSVCLWGGDAPHIGAVALAVPRPSLINPERISATASVIAVTGHKEDELARSLSIALASAAQCVVSASCGIHLEDAREKEIGEVLEKVREMIDEAKGALGSWPEGFPTTSTWSVQDAN